MLVLSHLLRQSPEEKECNKYVIYKFHVAEKTLEVLQYLCTASIGKLLKLSMSYVISSGNIQHAFIIVYILHSEWWTLHG